MTRLGEQISPTYYVEAPTLTALLTYAKITAIYKLKIYKELKELLIFLALMLYARV